MSARERLAEALTNPGLVGLRKEEADELINDFAREQAATIRKQTARRNLIRPEFEQAWEAGLHRGADVITPRDEDGAGLVGSEEETPARDEAPALRLVTDNACTATLQGWPIEVVEECVREAGHYDEADPDSWHQTEPGPDGTRVTWADSTYGATPHHAGPVRPGEEPT